jgi:ketosteroid isomerase-like protein
VSQANVEVWRTCLDAFNARDVDGFLRAMDPAIEFECQFGAVQGHFHGHDGVRKFCADVFDIYEEGRVETPDVRDLGDRLLILGTAIVNTKGSGIHLEGPVAIVASFENGLITHYLDFGNRNKALAAANVAE